MFMMICSLQKMRKRILSLPHNSFLFLLVLFLMFFRFERASIDIVKVEIEDIGSPTKIRLGHDGKGSRPAWFLERV